MRIGHTCRAALFAAALFWSAGSVQAQLQWGATGTGGNGTWDATTANWFNGTSATTWDGNVAVFGGTAGTVTVSGTQNATGMTIATTGYTLGASVGAGTINMTGTTPTITLGTTGGTGNTAVQLNSVISGSNQITLNTQQSSGVPIVNFNAANTFSGGLLVNSAMRVNFNQTGASGSGTITAAVSGTRFTNVNTSTASLITVTNNFNLNPGFLATPFNVSFGATNSSPVPTINYTGVISGAANVFLGNEAGTGGGAGITTFSNAMTYTGTTYVSGSANALFNLGVNNALPSSTVLNFGVINAGSANVGIVNLNGFNATISGLSSNTTGTIGGLTNSSSTVSVLTLGGSTTNTHVYNGVIGTATNTNLTASTNNIAVVVNNPALTQTFGRAAGNTFSGGMTITAGTLIAGNTTGSATGSGAITVNGGTGVLAGGTGSATTVGVVTGDTTLSAGGGIRADSSTGTNTFTVGNVTINNTGRLYVNLGASGTSSTLAFAGNSLDLRAGSIVRPDDITGFGYGTFTLATFTNGNTLLLDSVQTTDGQLLGSYVQGTGATGAVEIDVSELPTLTAGDRLELRRSGNNLVLNFSPVPEPGLLLAACGLVVGGVVGVRKLRRKQPDVTPAA
jgi:hypothetical protein